MKLITALLMTAAAAVPTPYATDNIYIISENRRVPLVATELHDTIDYYSIDEYISFDLVNNVVTEFYIGGDLLENGVRSSSFEIVITLPESMPINSFNFLGITYDYNETEGIIYVYPELELLSGLLYGDVFTLDWQFETSEVIIDFTNTGGYWLQLYNLNDTYYSIGFDTGYNDGLEEGIQLGYDTGYNDGYEEGFQNGKGEFSIFNFIKIIFDSLVTILNVEILPGISLWFIIGIPLILKVLEFILGWFR